MFIVLIYFKIINEARYNILICKHYIRIEKVKYERWSKVIF